MVLIRARGEDGKYLWYDDEVTKTEVVGKIEVIKHAKYVEEPKVKIIAKIKKML